jgi:hypothetical protein
MRTEGETDMAKEIVAFANLQPRLKMENIYTVRLIKDEIWPLQVK